MLPELTSTSPILKAFCCCQNHVPNLAFKGLHNGMQSNLPAYLLMEPSNSLRPTLAEPIHAPSGTSHAYSPTCTSPLIGSYFLITHGVHYAHPFRRCLKATFFRKSPPNCLQLQRIPFSPLASRLPACTSTAKGETLGCACYYNSVLSPLPD